MQPRTLSPTTIPQTVGEIMTRDVKTIPVEATLEEAAMMLNSYNISGAPVVDENGEMVGILSESDLLNQGRKEAALPRIAVFGLYIAAEETVKHAFREGAALPVAKVMTREVLTATEETSLTEAASTMLRKGINRLPILRDHTLVGIVTREDILRAMYHLPLPSH